MQQLQSGGKKGFPPETSKINLILEQHSLFPNLNSTAAKEKQSTYPEQICNNITSTLQYTQGGLTENRTNTEKGSGVTTDILTHKRLSCDAV